MGANCLKPKGAPWFNPAVLADFEQIARNRYGDSIKLARNASGARARRWFGQMATHFINSQRCGKHQRSTGEHIKHLALTVVKLGILISLVMKMIAINFALFSDKADTTIELTNQVLEIVLLTALSLYLMIVFFPWARPLPILTPTEVVFIFIAGVYLLMTAVQNSALAIHTAKSLTSGA